jgi:uncharacterized protein DUF5320
MPGGDGNGPVGRGPMTGKGMGYCVGQAPVGGGIGRGMARGARCYGGLGRGAGFGMGRGVGMGQGVGRFSQTGLRPMTAMEEADLLRMEEQQLNNSLHEIKNRLSKLESEKET